VNPGPPSQPPEYAETADRTVEVDGKGRARIFRGRGSIRGLDTNLEAGNDNRQPALTEGPAAIGSVAMEREERKT
jgi:hypothetical protein